MSTRDNRWRSLPSHMCTTALSGLNLAMLNVVFSVSGPESALLSLRGRVVVSSGSPYVLLPHQQIIILSISQKIRTVRTCKLIKIRHITPHHIFCLNNQAEVWSFWTGGQDSRRTLRLDLWPKIGWKWLEIVGQTGCQILDHGKTIIRRNIFF